MLQLGKLEYWVQLDPSKEGDVKLLLLDSRKRKMGSIKLPRDNEDYFLNLFGEENIPRKFVFEVYKTEDEITYFKMIEQ